MTRLALPLALSIIMIGCSRTPREEKRNDEASKGQRRTGPDATPSAGAHRISADTGDLFVDITRESGVRFQHFNDASSRRFLPETMGSGAAFFDYDGDGRPDLYLVNGAPLTGDRSHARPGALYRNLDGAHFLDVTSAAGLIEPLYGMGVAVGDYDNDGNIDLFVSALQGDRLYRNRGNGTFEDVTRRTGLTGGGFSSSAAFFDYDRDGFLDLFVGRYVEWSPKTDVACTPDGNHRMYCTPEVYPGQTNRLYRNIGGRMFRDVTRSSGLYQPGGKSLGVAIFDHNRDGWPDIAVANDTVRNFLFINNRNGTFSESGEAAGLAYSESGATRGGMGIDIGDLDGDGLPDVVIGNFAQEMSALYRSSSKGFFVDDAAQAGIGIPTLMYLAFGTLLLDLDNDGLLDVVIVNGHIEPEIAKIHPRESYAQPPQFFHNEGSGRFKLMTGREGRVSEMQLVGRGLAAADIDGDGDLDLVITQNGRETVLLRNNAPPQSWLRLRLVGRVSNRTGYGAIVRVVSGDRSWTRFLTSGRSYLSASEPVLTFGLGDVRRLDRLEITWPSGIIQTVENPPLKQLIAIEENAPRR
jgi:hypothetical protein